ncbi:MAG: hypothetical protein IJ928_01805 [Prevotella sp.]|nr:hypothetical protein [Prevotella sp.]
MKRVFPVILTLLLLTACVENQPARVAMEQATALMETRPDSALGILLALPEEDSAAMTKEQRMRWLLLRQQGMNKCDTVFRSDSIPLILVKWFDRHGTPNEQMLAHYLLGRAYVDMGESPEALQAFQDAIDHADTTATDCNFSQLGRIHMHKSELLYNQYQPELALKELEKAAHFAALAKDTLDVILSKNFTVRSFYQLNMFDSMAVVARQCRKEFQKIGREDYAVGFSSWLIWYDYAIENNLEEARRLLEEKRRHLDFEHASSNKIGTFYGHYGWLLIAEGKLDSSIICFRKVLATRNDWDQKYVKAFQGLYRAYTKMGVRDSAIKYAGLYCAANDSSNIFRSSEQVARTQALYDYEHHRTQALQSKHEAERLRLVVVILVLAAVLLTVLTWMHYRHVREKMKAELANVNRDYYGLLTDYQKARHELSMLKEDNERNLRLVALKEAEEKELRQMLSAYMPSMKKEDEWELSDEVFTSDIIKKLHRKATKGKTATGDDFMELEELVNMAFPTFIPQIGNLCPRLRPQQHRLCLLTKLRFIPSEIATLMGKTPQAVSNMRSRACSALFGTERGTADFDQLIEKM